MAFENIEQWSDFSIDMWIGRIENSWKTPKLKEALKRLYKEKEERENAKKVQA